MYCPKCGQQVPDSAKVCGFCGWKLSARPQRPIRQQANPLQPAPIIVQTTSSGGFFSGLGGLLNLALTLLVVGAIGFVLLSFMCVIHLPSNFPFFNPPASLADLWSRAVDWQGGSCANRYQDTASNPAAVNNQGNSGANSCNSSKFAYETIPDNTSFKPGEKFTKTWTVRNTGNCTWTTDYTFRFMQGAQMGGPKSVALTKDVKTGETYTFKLDLTAPNAPGTSTGRWEIFDEQENSFGWYSVVIDVASKGQAPKPAEVIIHRFFYKNNSENRIWSFYLLGVKSVGQGTVKNPGETEEFMNFDHDKGFPAGTYKVKVEWRKPDGGDFTEEYPIKFTKDEQTILLPP
jgi:hypothetical protein